MTPELEETVVATLRQGKSYTLMTPNANGEAVVFTNGIPQKITKDTRAHLEKAAITVQETKYPNGRIERMKTCSFEFLPLTHKTSEQK
ncbi:hypothetical protein SAMN05444000_12844 [Shimia gijangensis]|uniref:Uncharacterized protein n=1 Tax=Shimia gijangensis TaxID=1470563 RepID=A0A1M6SBW7_9RHOB|nr:hypothetical protein [Shimia gijangensis]SHK42017.1 hypothetical protein SAMN05444000_12844 [Shimia gijangensis]